MPLISFIIPYYNLPLDLIRQCVESIVALSIEAKEREIIVVDDGSDVDVRNELLAVCPDLIYIRQENGGLSAARNAGLAVATGFHIQFVDGDDRLIPSVYDKIVKTLKYNLVDILLFRYMEDENKIEYKFKLKRYENGEKYMENHNLRASACGYVFSKYMLHDGLRFPVGRYHEDEYFTPKLMTKAKIIYSTECTPYFYNLRSNSITTTRDESHIRKRLDDLRDAMFSLVDYYNAVPFMWFWGLWRRVNQLTMDYIFNIITTGQGWEELQRRIKELKDKEAPYHPFFPLPLRFYTLKYFLFALIADTKPGLFLLYKVLSRFKRKR